MDGKQFMACVQETSAYKNCADYVSDVALSSMWGDSPEDDIPEERIENLKQIWRASNRNMKDIAKDAGLSQRKLAERFAIPYRTMENWCAGVCTPPDYVRIMMQECLGLLGHLGK